MKIRLVVAELYHADRRTDITKLIVTLRNFANAPEKTVILYSSQNVVKSAFRCYISFKNDYIVEQLSVYTGCPRRNVPDFGRVFLRSKYTDIIQNTYIQSSMVTEILAREKCGLLWCLHSILCP